MYERPDIKLNLAQFSDDPRLVIDTGSLDFGTLLYEATSDVMNVQLSNFGGGTIELDASNFAITGTNATLFSIDASVFPISLATAQNADIGISLVANVEGDISAALEITYDGETTPIAMTAYVLPEGTSIVQVGDGTSYQQQPFGALYGYERSSAVYLADDIGRAGVIESIGWDVAVASETPIPYKIYLGVSDAETQYDSSQYFSTLISNMTLVSQGSYAFDTVGWHTFDLADPFTLVGGNLVVAIETNYGGGGAGSYPRFYYTIAADKHEWWRQDNSAPSISNTINGNRPNIELTLSPLPGEAVLMVQLESHDFGTIPYGIDSNPVQIGIMNAGGAPLIIDESNLSFSGADAAMFVYDADVLPLTLESGERGSLAVHVNSTTAGAISTTLTIAVGTQTAEIALTADILPEGVFEAIVGRGVNAGQATGTSGVSPYMGNYRSYRIHNLVRGSEIVAAGGIPGFIDAISYNVANLNTYEPMPDYRIRIKQTSLNTLSSVFQTTDFVEVFSSNDFMPSVMSQRLV